MLMAVVSNTCKNQIHLSILILLLVLYVPICNSDLPLSMYPFHATHEVPIIILPFSAALISSSRNCFS